MTAACCDLQGPRVCYLSVGPSSAHPGGGFPPRPGLPVPRGGRGRVAPLPGAWGAAGPHRWPHLWADGPPSALTARPCPPPALQPLPTARGPPPAAPAGPAQDRGGAGHPEGPPGGAAAPHTPARARAELPGRPDPAGPGVGETRPRPRCRGRGESWGPASGRGAGDGPSTPWPGPSEPRSPHLRSGVAARPHEPAT